MKKVKIAWLRFRWWVVRQLMKLERMYLLWVYYKLIPWFKRHKEDRFFKYLENASWFRWYGKRVVYVKPNTNKVFKGDKKDVAEAIKSKDYKKALEILDGMKASPQTASLRQIIEAKLKETA